MAHQITKTDNIVLHRAPAWHGLGTIVQEAPTPQEALKIAGLDWEVEQTPLYTILDDGQGNQTRFPVDSHVSNVRRDTNEVLGIVGKNYTPVQNSELALFAEALAEQGDIVRVETAGSILGGRKVWFLVKGESFSVRKDDEVVPYILVSNGHDGYTSLRCTPTTVRVVCSNTLHMVIPRSGGASTKTPGYTTRHMGDVEEKVEHAKAALALYGKSVADQRELMGTLASVRVTKKKIEEFWLDVYQQQYGAIPTDPKNGHEERRRATATEAFGKMAQHFDEEKKLAGATAWNAFNAYTNWQQNDKAYRNNDTRTSSLLFSRTGNDAVEAFSAAFQMA